ncbi:MAG: HAD-IB family hydrolase [Acidimicrobiia bacterium]
MERITVAAFDFDKTLSTRDNGVPFFTSIAGRAAVARALVACMPDIARGRRDAVKTRITRSIFAGRDARVVEKAGAAFAEDILEQHLRDDVIERAAWHAEQGHLRVIISASYDCYVAPAAQALGFDAALATLLTVGDDGVLTGAIEGQNVRRAEKVARLERWLDERGLAWDAITLWAYGDSVGDAELLARADHPIRVGRRRVIRMPAQPDDR